MCALKSRQSSSDVSSDGLATPKQSKAKNKNLLRKPYCVALIERYGRRGAYPLRSDPGGGVADAEALARFPPRIRPCWPVRRTRTRPFEVRGPQALKGASHGHGSVPGVRGDEVWDGADVTVDMTKGSLLVPAAGKRREDLGTTRWLRIRKGYTGVTLRRQ